MEEMLGARLLGRTAEKAVLLDLLRGTARGRGGALVLRGAAGVGKSALLAQARQVGGAADMRVLPARGVPAEADLPFAALHQLLGPLLHRADALPQPRRQALLGAFGVVEDDAPSTFRIALAALQLLTDVAAERPLLAVVDDLQWFDDESRRVVEFLARRLTADPVVLLAATQDGWPPLSRDTGVSELRLEGLPPDDAERLLTAVAPGLRAEVRRLVLQYALGNPLALRELPLTLDCVDVLDGRTWVPLTERLEVAFTGRLADLPAATHTFVLTAALHCGDDVDEVSAAARAVDPAADLTALPPAIAAGLVTVSGGRLRFCHPLTRSAVCQAADPHQRARTSRVLAGSPSRIPEHGLWHRVAATAGPDPELAAELEDLASSYVRRGTLDEALRALERSAALTVDETARGRRLVDAASTALHLGRVDDARQLLGRTHGLGLAPRDTDRRRLLVWAVRPPSPSDAGGTAEIVDVACRCAADGDRETAVSLLLVAARTVALAGREESCGARVVAALDVVGGAADDPRRLLVRACASPLRSGPDVVRAARRARSQGLDAKGTALLALAAMRVHAADAAAPLFDVAAAGLRQRGDLLSLSQLLLVRGWAGFFLGAWEDGLADAAEGARLSRDTQQPLSAAALEVLDALLWSLRGSDDGFAATMTAAEQTGLRLGGAAVLNVVQLARALACITAGAYDAAVDHLLRIYVRDDPAYHQVHGCAWLTYLAEAAVHCGRRSSARAVLSDVEALVALTDASQLNISVQYARAVLADDDDAEPLYQRALRADLAAWPLDRARLDLAWGGWLRRRRRTAESREPLRRARDAFDAIGAIGWAAHARRELRAAGERSSSEFQYQQPHGLTAQELQIAQLAAAGLSNREIGQRIYASHRTVGSHLYRIYPKLGITSRQQLGRVIREADRTV